MTTAVGHSGVHVFTKTTASPYVRACVYPKCSAILPFNPPRARALPPAPAVQGSRTSEAAARAQTDENRTTKKNRILAAIKGTGRDGLTDQAGQEITGIPGDTYRVRRGELFRENKIIKANRLRLTKSGNEAEVWIAR